MDGFIDVWDFFYRQNEVAYSQKVSDSPLTSISVNQSMAAIGDADGTVSMMQLCRTLYDYTLQPKEKEIMQTIFERESRREKALEVAKRMAEMKKPPKKDTNTAEKKAEKLQNYLNDIEENFFKHVAEDGEQLEHIKQRGEFMDGFGTKGHDLTHMDDKKENGGDPDNLLKTSGKPAPVQLAVGDYIVTGTY